MKDLCRNQPPLCRCIRWGDEDFDVEVDHLIHNFEFLRLELEYDMLAPGAHCDSWQHFAPTVHFTSGTKEEPDTSPRLLEFLHLPFIHQVHQNQCGYPPIPYLPKESVLTTFFRRNNKRH